MNKATLVSERPLSQVVVHPGTIFFGDGTHWISTLLGSSVAAVVWHPQRRIGGLCHYLLPSRRRAGGTLLDPRYGDEALALLHLAAVRVGAATSEYLVKLVGGSAAASARGSRKGELVGQRNVEVGRRELAERGFIIASEHVAGTGHRAVHLALGTGTVLLRHQPRLPVVEPI